MYQPNKFSTYIAAFSLTVVLLFSLFSTIALRFDKGQIQFNFEVNKTGLKLDADINKNSFPPEAKDDYAKDN
jgi:hypothetical protein